MTFKGGVYFLPKKEGIYVNNKFFSFILERPGCYDFNSLICSILNNVADITTYDC